MSDCAVKTPSPIVTFVVSASQRLLTPACAAIRIYGSNVSTESAVASYDGVYNKMMYNGKTYWAARNDVGGVTDSNLDVKLYYYEGVYGIYGQVGVFGWYEKFP